MSVREQNIMEVLRGYRAHSYKRALARFRLEVDEYERTPVEHMDIWLRLAGVMLLVFYPSGLAKLLREQAANTMRSMIDNIEEVER